MFNLIDNFVFLVIFSPKNTHSHTHIHTVPNANRLIFVQIIHAPRLTSAMIMATTSLVNAQKEEAVLIAAKFHERYVSWILSIIHHYIYRLNWKVSVTRFQLICHWCAQSEWTNERKNDRANEWMDEQQNARVKSNQKVKTQNVNGRKRKLSNKQTTP